jgi:hypothetical protein
LLAWAFLYPSGYGSAGGSYRARGCHSAAARGPPSQASPAPPLALARATRPAPRR